MCFSCIFRVMPWEDIYAALPTKEQINTFYNEKVPPYEVVKAHTLELYALLCEWLDQACIMLKYLYREALKVKELGYEKYWEERRREEEEQMSKLLETDDRQDGADGLS